MSQTSSTSEPWGTIDEHLRRTLSSARAARGLSWEDLARELGKRGWVITPGNLMTRHSRCAFRADEYVLLMDVLGVSSVSTHAGVKP